MAFADTHSHLNFSVFDADRESLLRQCDGMGIRLIIIPGVKRSGWQKIMQLCNSSHILYGALGLHPNYIEEHSQADFDEMDKLLLFQRHDKNLIAIGETGLDARYGNIAMQREYLENHLCLAEKHKLPIILHAVKAHHLLIERIKKHKNLVGGVVHGYSGSYEQAIKYWNCGIYIGVGGVITHDKANKTRNAVSRLPLDSLVLETDSPDMAVQGQLTSRNTPLNLLKIFKALSEIRHKDSKELEDVLWKNSLILYQLKI